MIGNISCMGKLLIKIRVFRASNDYPKYGVHRFTSTNLGSRTEIVLKNEDAELYLLLCDTWHTWEATRATSILVAFITMETPISLAPALAYDSFKLGFNFLDHRRFIVVILFHFMN